MREGRCFYECVRKEKDGILCSYTGVQGECRFKLPPDEFRCFFEERFGEKSAMDSDNWECNKDTVRANIDLITKLADDIWAVAKKMESGNMEKVNELKTISSCLHDIRAGRDETWYKKFEVKDA